MWAKISDDFFRNPKIVAAGRDARDLYLVGLCHCNEHLTDGFIDAAYLRRLAADAEIDDAKSAAARLIEVGLWHETDRGYQVHDFDVHNILKGEVEAKAKANADRQEKWRSQRNAHRNTSSNALQTPPPEPVPVPVSRVVSDETTTTPLPPQPAADVVAAISPPNAKPFDPRAPLPQDVEQFLERSPDPVLWRSALLAAMDSRPVTDVTRYALGILRCWKATGTLPSQPSAPPPSSFRKVSAYEQSLYDRQAGVDALFDEAHAMLATIPVTPDPERLTTFDVGRPQ